VVSTSSTTKAQPPKLNHQSSTTKAQPPKLNHQSSTTEEGSTTEAQQPKLRYRGLGQRLSNVSEFSEWKILIL